MSLISVDFLLFAFCSIILLRLITRLSVRAVTLLGLNAAFFSSFFSSVSEALPVLSMVIIGYLCLPIVARFRSTMLLGLMVSGIVFLFAWLKRYSLIEPLLPANATPLVVVGLSYILFRVLHVLIDVAQGDKTVPHPLGYLNYCLFFPAFVSGPIQRYEDFDVQMRQPAQPLSVSELYIALCRIMLGILFIVICSQSASHMVDLLKQTRILSSPHHAEWLRTTVYFSLISFASLFNIFMNFAGSMHIVIGVAALTGFRLPENFNKPYQAKNFHDLWARWHMTLSEWIKCYLFNPLLKWLTLRFPTVSGNYLGPIAFFVAFAVTGLWHGTTLLFALFGFMMGSGATINKLWQQFMAKRLGKAGYKALVQRDWYYQLSRALTISYIAIATICLWAEPGYISSQGILWCLFIAIASLFLMTIGLTLFCSAMEWVLRFVVRYIQPIRFPSSERAMILSMALAIWLVLNLVSAFGSNTPEFIYKGF